MKVEFNLDPFDLAGISKSDVSRSARKDILDEVTAYLTDAIKKDVKDATSPVTGEAFQGLSDAYKAKKKAAGKGTKANLIFTGKLIDSIRVKATGGEVNVTVLKSQQDKADGHNNFSGDSKLPERKFIPNEDNGESFRKGILDEIVKIVESRVEEDKAGTSTTISAADFLRG